MSPYGHRPVPGRAPGRWVSCGYRNPATGLYCGWLLTVARNGNGLAHHWRHMPNGPTRQIHPAMREGWAAITGGRP